MKILIATPTQDGRVHREYAISMMQLSTSLFRRATCVTAFSNTAQIFDARNWMATKAVLDKSFDYLLMIDSDMGFQPSLIERMLAFRKPVVGCIYPTNPARKPVADFVGANELTGEVRNGFQRTTLIGAGIMLIARSALEMMRKQFPDLWSNEPHPYHPELPGFFQPFFPMFDGKIGLSEDVSFCRRWLSCGGEIWANIDEPIWHNGVRAKLR